jgi:hypothetical protein
LPLGFWTIWSRRRFFSIIFSIFFIICRSSYRT